jgi:formylglycine-generating enzyme required for sulfatase activity
MREARLGAGLEHERVARVYDVAEHDGSTFVAMEYVRGVTLRAWMAEPREPAQILAIVTQIAEGLEVLHAAGVMHRDLKPENVMLQAQGGVKLLDFGLAGHLSPADARAATSALPDGPIGSLSHFLGTPGYMAPEQYAGERADSRADVFALGVIIHELVAGERPFRGPTINALLAASRARELHLDAPSWQRFPPELATVVAKMLEPDASARYADGEEVLAALAPLAAPQETSAAKAQPVAPRPRRTLALVGVVALGATAVAVAPSVSKALALRRALSRPPPTEMALIDEGTITVGQSEETVAKQCAEIGPKCNPKLMHYQVPAFAVAVPPFYLDQYEVTNADFARVLTSMVSGIVVEPDEESHVPRYARFNAGLGHTVDHLLDLAPPLNGIEYEAPRFKAVAGRERWPATQVTWFGARFYCSAIGKRLPTENEWEAAARGRANRPYPWGSEAPRCGDVILPSDGFLVMSPGCPKLLSPGPVDAASQDVTPQGIHDLAGNVAEWVDTAYAEGWRGAVAPADAVDPPRILRGGSFFFSLLAATSVRNKRPPGYVGYDLGFRCASDIVDTTHQHP